MMTNVLYFSSACLDPFMLRLQISHIIHSIHPLLTKYLHTVHTFMCNTSMKTFFFEDFSHNLHEFAWRLDIHLCVRYFLANAACPVLLLSLLYNDWFLSLQSGIITHF